MNIVVLAGGLSPERDVSLSSGCLIANALIENGHRVLLADVYMGVGGDVGGIGGAARTGGLGAVDGVGAADGVIGAGDADGGARGFEQAYQAHRRERYEYRIPEAEPDLAALAAARGGGPALIEESILPICVGADVVFLALHGSIGENGQLQAALDLHGVRYTGTGFTGSLLAMDKPLSKELMRFHGIDTPDWGIYNIADGAPPPGGLTFPCVIKPCACGSSIGVSIVKSAAEFTAALAYAGKYEDRVMIEQMIPGREFSIGILGSEALPPIEIIPKAGFYDYKNKYQPGLTEEVCPAELPAGLSRAMQETALRVHAALRLGDYSRIDFILDGAGRWFCLEANTLPGMTPTSLLPQEARAVGIPYNALCERLVKLACERERLSPERG
ncbi:MAG: D-alanine--D-alanine ligase [Clostridiales bacterium]|jgi:D-alanine-D-alanine ligase|nr:D-alanine--D-alanine ligase [Clostridiales bacterium]